MTPQSVFLASLLATALSAQPDYNAPYPFGKESQTAHQSDNVAIGEWWKYPSKENGPHDSPKGNKKSWPEQEMAAWLQSIPREKALAFALYTHDHGVLKLTAQCFPLLPDEPKMVSLEFQRNGIWEKSIEQPVNYPGWDVQFRIENWDNSEDVPYRLRLADLSTFEGLIRKDPVDKDTLVVASMSCNSPRDKERFTRNQVVQNLQIHNPDLLFFAGDQNYTHDEATFGWLQFGMQFRDVMKDRPTVCIPDDHDIGHGNLWGAGGKASSPEFKGNDGGYMYPPSFVNMVQRQQTSNLPDPFDSTPVEQGIGVYYTDLNVGGVSFAILEDRKFKSAPKGNIPQMGPRPDHINDPSYDRNAINLPGLKLLGERQLEFLDHWARDWTDASMKVALSQTAFAGAVHLHGSPQKRLLADLDCNGWPQNGRDNALRILRAARATHLCGDQHLGVVVQHGIESHRDGPFAFTSPALVNTVYGRWWWPESESTGLGAPVQSILPWVGDYEDGLGNKITMMAYANPEAISMNQIRKDSWRENRGDGYGLIHIHKPSGDITFECWPRFADLSQGDSAQFEGWPITFNTKQNDGRKTIGTLPRVELPTPNAVVALTDSETGELIYCYRTEGESFEAPVFAEGTFTLTAGLDSPKSILLDSVQFKQ
ncbi:MAG: hypothetical protein ACPGN3_01305 [Opitutales bacterium]